MFTKFAQEAQQDDEGVWVPLKNKRGEPHINPDGTAARLRIAGPFSAVVRKADAANLRAALRQKRKELDADELADRGRTKLAAAIIGWEHVQADDGTEAPHSPANAYALLAAAPWIAEQVAEVLNDFADFFGTG